MTLTSGSATVSLCASADAGSMKSAKVALANATVRTPRLPRAARVVCERQSDYFRLEAADAPSRFGSEIFPIGPGIFPGP
jgi:hypothetical protein